MTAHSTLQAAALTALVLALVHARVALAQAAPAGSPAPLATVTVDTRTIGASIPRDFIGISLEVSTAGQGIGAFQGAGAAPAEQPVYALGHPGAPNRVYFRLLRNLGAGILRLGGNSQDNTCWDKAHAPHPEACEGGLDAGDLRLFAAAARGSGWPLIVGLNLKQNAPEWALAEVTEGVAREIPASLVFALEPGNEPDLFSRTPYRPRSYTPADQVPEFVAYLRAFAAHPVARRYPLAGPATCCPWRNAPDLAVFLDGVGPAHLKWVTVHNYSATTCGGQTLSIARLLSRELMDGFNEEARPLVAVARERGLPIAMAETNSASCGGMPGVSNAFASALWGLDYAFSLATDGFVNVAFHTSYRPSGGSSYNPVDTYGRQDAAGRWRYRNVAEPLYYAMYLFARHAAGGHLVDAAVESGANVRAYAVTRCTGCAVEVFVLNKDTTASGPVRVHLSRRMGMGSILLLSAPGQGSLAPEVRLGGRQFDAEGRIGTPGTLQVRPDAAGDYAFDLPNAAIALLTVAPASR
jgi:hypothetical protein